MHPESDPDVVWTAALAGRTEAAAQRALNEAVKDGRLYREIAREHESEGRTSYIEIDAPLELYALVRLLRPRDVIEAGVSSGVSSAYILEALARNGHGTLHSIDRPSKPRKNRSGKPTQASWSLPAGRSSGWAVPKRLVPGWDLRLGDKAKVLPELLGELDRVDLVLYDLPHDCEVVWEEFRTIDPILPRGGVAIIDHGPGGGLCDALRHWAKERATQPIRRSGLGLFGLRAESDPRTEVVRPRAGRPVASAAVLTA